MAGELVYFLLGAVIGGAAMWFAACAVLAGKYSSSGQGPTVQSIAARLEREGMSRKGLRSHAPAHRAQPR